jgi:excisionase family DNA binding protein
MMRDRPYTPETLAERWQCSARYVRKLLENGSLKGFRLGKLWRIPACEVIALKTQLAAQAPAGILTLGVIFQRYIEDREAEGKPTTRIGNAWKRLGPHYADMRPIDINKGLTRDYIANRGKDGVGPGTIHTELVYLRAVLAFAVRERWITQAPYIPVPQKPSPKEHHLTKSEAQLLLDAAVMPHVQLFIRLALATAGRMSAILELTWDRVDLVGRRINLRDPNKPVTRKGRAVVPINEWLYLPSWKRGGSHIALRYRVGRREGVVGEEGRRSLREAGRSEVFAACLAPHSCRVDGRGRCADGRDCAIPRARGRQNDVPHLRALLAGLPAARGKNARSVAQCSLVHRTRDHVQNRCAAKGELGTARYSKNRTIPRNRLCSHRRGHWFESSTAHHPSPSVSGDVESRHWT